VAVIAGERRPVPPSVRIDSRRRWLGPSPVDLWHYRELLGFLVWRDVKVRYKQTILGVLWVAVQPLATTVVFALVFGRFANLPSEGVPYPLFVLAAMLPWQLFASAIGRAGPSLVNSAPIITKVYFPRVLVPVAAVFGSLVDLLIALAALGVLFVWYGEPLRAALVWLPAATAFALLAAVGVGIWLSALNVYFRDVQQALPFLSQVLMFVSPVAYSSTLVPQGALRLLYALNPVTGIVHVFRWSLLGVAVPWDAVAISGGVTALLLVSGLALFGRVEDSFADVV
jgi:lipopolysaccharide transport system permease protein